MQINKLKENELDSVIEFYIKHKKDFVGLCTIEDFSEQFCHKCDTCGRIVCVLDMCEECDIEKNIDEEWERFDREKEHYIYGL